MERVQQRLKTKLYDYQQEEFEIMVRRKRWLLVEKTGKGKSLASLATFLNLYNRGKLDNLFVTAPRNAYDRKVWRDECLKHTTFKPIDLEELVQKSGGSIERLKKLLPYYPVIYAKHSHVNVYRDFIRDIIAMCRCQVIIDEVHKLKNPKSTLTVNSRYAYYNAFSMGGLTATPLSKDMADCYNIINFIKPWFLGTFEQFRKDFCFTQQKVIGRNVTGGLKKVEEIVGIKSIAALQQRLDPLVIRGTSLLEVKWDFVKYEMGVKETSIYRRLSKGFFCSTTASVEVAEDWFRAVMAMNEETPQENYQVGDVDRHSSRFIYMQYAADGIVSDNGDIGLTHRPEPCKGEKIDKALDVLREIYRKGESCIIYFDYYATLETFEYFLRKSALGFKILKTTGEQNIKDGQISEAKVKNTPHVILATKAGSESSSFYYMNHVMLFNIPTTPETFTQIVGRITRANTLFPDDLNCHVMMSDNIDLYKMAVVCNKAAQMEAVSNEESNIPNYYKKAFSKRTSIADCKKYLLWDQKRASVLLESLE